MTVTEALARLRADDARARREAALFLGERAAADAVRPLAWALKDPDRGVRQAAEAALWAIWMRSGDPETDALLLRGTRLMEAGDHEGAIACFSEVIARAPGFAEGYNKRATALYLAEQYARSLYDCRETLKRNPVHFGALSGQGLCFLALGWAFRARRCFERALAINPNMPGVRQNLAHLDRLTRFQAN